MRLHCIARLKLGSDDLSSVRGGGRGGDVSRAARLGSEGPASAPQAVSSPRRCGPGALHTSSWLDVAISPQSPGVSVVNVAVQPLFCQLKNIYIYTILNF